MHALLTSIIIIIIIITSLDNEVHAAQTVHMTHWARVLQLGLT